MAGAFGRHIFGREPFGGSPTAAPGSAIAYTQGNFSLELWSGGSLVARLIDWISARYTKTVNEPSTLEMTYPITGEWYTQIAYPKYIVVRDRVGAVVDRLYVATVSVNREMSGTQIATVGAEDFLAQLGWEEIAEYKTTSVTVRAFVEYLLAQQQITYVPKIAMGSMDATIADDTRVPDVVNKSILETLRELRDTLGGYFWVDTGGRLNWKNEMAPAWGQQIRLGKNLPRMKVDKDYRTIRTKVVAYGKGMSPDTRITSTKTYNTGTYGTIPIAVNWPNVSVQAELDRKATKLVRQLGQPTKHFDCGVIDLSMVDIPEQDYTHERLLLGARVRVIDEVLDETVDTRLLKIARDLVAPAAVTVEVADPATDITVSSTASMLTDAILDLMQDMSDTMTDPGFEDSLAEAITENTDVQAALADRIENDPVVSAAVAAAVAAAVGGVVPSPGTGITAVGSTSVDGVSDDYARVDHVHAGATVGTSIQSVGTANSAGSGSNFARDNHVHKGHNFTASDAASLPAESDGDMGATTGTNKRGYGRVDSAWLCWSHLE